jgi:hypothetical protein
MSEVVSPILIFVCLLAASLGSLAIYTWFPAQHRQEDTHAIVKLAANLFVIMTSLVLGLMISSAKTTFESIDRNVHSLATDLILLDRVLLEYGPEATDARQRLLAYVKQTVDHTWHANAESPFDDSEAEQLLNDVGTHIRSIKTQDAEHAELRQEALERFQTVLEQRWALIEQSDGTIPTPIIMVVVVWLVLIFASFGYRAPRNPVVVATLFVAAALISTAIYLILDMDAPFAGPIQIAPAPLERVIVQMQR